MRKRIFAVLSVFFLFLPSCKGPAYRSDLSAEALAKSCADELAVSDVAFETEESFSGEEMPFCDPELSVCYATDGNNLDEFGIWKTRGEKPRKVATFLSDSLLKRYRENESFYQSYIPEEIPKLRDAEVRVYGDYVVYAVLSPQQKKEFFQFLEKTLAKNQEKPAM